MRPAPVSAGVLLLAACGGSPVQGPTVTVFAAASLKQPFTALGEQYERENPGTDVVFNFAGSSDLVAQMEQGAEADVLATADAATMDTAESALGLSAQPFARNTMTIVVPADNPAGVDSLADLQDPRLRTVVCAPQVPCGAATRRVAGNAGIDIAAVSEEASVTDVLGKVGSGEADAGIVYVSDVATAGDTVRGIGIPARVNTVNEYFIASGSETGRGFAGLVLGPAGQATLEADGFQPR